MKPYIKKTGGIRIGNLNLTYPFVKLFVEPEQITFYFFFFKTITIPKENLAGIYKYEFLPFIGEGIAFKLKSEKKFSSIILKSNKIIFWHFGDREKLLQEIKMILT